MALVRGGKRLADGDRRAYGALGIVLVRRRGAEHGHDRVPDELLDRAPSLFELLTNERVVRREHRPHVLDVHALRPAREPDHVGKEHRDHLPLLPPLRGRRER